MIRAYLREDFAGRYLAVALIREGDGVPQQILRIEDAGSPTTYRWEDLPDVPSPDLAPTLEIGDSEARALLEALVRYYNGAEDTRALRRDYDHERERVDRLTEALGTVVGNLSAPPYAVNTSGRREPVFTAEQWRKISDAGRGVR
jgi:hypothetical protein